MKTKKEWIEELTKTTYTNSKIVKFINGKKHSISYFSYYASEEHKADRELNILNFENTGNVIEIAEGLIDFDFLEKSFKVKESSKIFLLPYQWKNNYQEKKFLKQFLDIIGHRQRDYRSNEIMWTFEPGFWSDLSYTKVIKDHDYDYLNVAIINELNISKNSTETDYLIEIVNKIPYYLKYIKSKLKSSLPEETILSYAKDYGLTSLTKEQKNRYEIVKQAFNNHKINYKNLDDKWKTKETLKDLLNNRYIWNHSTNSEDHINIHQLTPELLADKEIIKSCLSSGHNLLELKKNTFSASKWFHDKELKKIALKTYNHYQIIEDCLDDRELVLEFINNFNKKNEQSYSGIALFEETKRIGVELFKDKEIMLNYLSIKNLNNKNYIVKNATEALKSYPIEDLIELITINSEAYKLLPDDMKNKWELVFPFYLKNLGSSNEMPNDIYNIIKSHGTGNNFEENVIQIRKYALNEKLKKVLEEKRPVKAIKI